jgi:hypothetical protein
MCFLTVRLQSTLWLPSASARTHTLSLSLCLSASLLCSPFISVWYKNPGNLFELINWIKNLNCTLVLISKVSLIWKDCQWYTLACVPLTILLVLMGLLTMKTIKYFQFYFIHFLAKIQDTFSSIKYIGDMTLVVRSKCRYGNHKNASVRNGNTTIICIINLDYRFAYFHCMFAINGWSLYRCYTFLTPHSTSHTLSLCLSAI